MARFKNHLPEW